MSFPNEGRISAFERVVERVKLKRHRFLFNSEMISFPLPLSLFLFFLRMYANNLYIYLLFNVIFY